MRKISAKKLSLLLIIVIVLSVFLKYRFLIPRGTHFEIASISITDLDKLPFRNAQENALNISENALKNIYSFQNATSDFPVFSTCIDSVWGANFYNRSHLLYTQTISILENLAHAHHLTGNTAFLEKGKEIVLSWSKMNSPKHFGNFRNAWGDHVSAERIINIICFVGYSQNYIHYSVAEKKTIQRILEQSYYYLSCNNNYTFNHNHGLIQDLALCLLINNMSIEDRDYSRVQNRFKRQISYLISEQGIETENSTNYQFFLNDLIKSILLFLPENIKNEQENTVKEKINLLAENIGAFYDFNNNINPMGDTIVENFQIIDSLQNEYAITDQQAGFSILKENHLYLAIRASGSNKTHKHHDELSYIFSLGSKMLTTEAGFLNYEKDKRTDFTVSPQGHNSILPFSFLDNYRKNFMCVIKNYIDSRLIYYNELEAKSGKNSISRSFFIDKKNQILIVYDNISETDEPNWLNLLYLNDELEIKSLDKHTLKIDKNIFISSADTISIKKGSNKPFIGWKAKPHFGLYPNTIIYQKISDRGAVVFSVGEPVKNIKFEGQTITYTYNERINKLKYHPTDIEFNGEKISKKSVPLPQKPSFPLNKLFSKKIDFAFLFMSILLIGIINFCKSKRVSQHLSFLFLSVAIIYILYEVYINFFLWH